LPAVVGRNAVWLENNPQPAGWVADEPPFFAAGNSIASTISVLSLSMAALWKTLSDLSSGAEELRRWRYGVIDVRRGQLHNIQLRHWPKMVSLASVVWGQWYHKHMPGDRMRLYFNQPIMHPNFLALKFAISAKHTTWATAHRALLVLDEIAQIKQSDALLCDAANFRLSPRMLAREGWQPHAASRWHRNYIKRFYGDFPRLWLPQEIQRDDALAKTA
jgi:hypothetical protein